MQLTIHVRAATIRSVAHMRITASLAWPLEPSVSKPSPNHCNPGGHHPAHDQSRPLETRHSLGPRQGGCQDSGSAGGSCRWIKAGDLSLCSKVIILACRGRRCYGKPSRRSPDSSFLPMAGVLNAWHPVADVVLAGTVRVILLVT
jgi:hypothetical protein